MRPPSTNSCVMMWPYLIPESSVCTWKTLPLWRTLLLYPRRGDVGLGDMDSASATAQAKQCTISASRTNWLGDYGDLPCCRISQRASGGRDRQDAKTPRREAAQTSGSHTSSPKASLTDRSRRDRIRGSNAVSWQCSRSLLNRVAPAV